MQTGLMDDTSGITKYSRYGPSRPIQMHSGLRWLPDFSRDTSYAKYKLNASLNFVQAF